MPRHFRSRFLCLAAFLLLISAHPRAMAKDHVLESEQWYNWTSDGVRHFVYEIGPSNNTSDPIVVLHGGWGAEHSYLIKPMLPIAEKYRLVFYDQRGSLRTPADESTITMERLVEDLDELRSALGQEKLTLVAHSMGNALAYAYLSKYPNRVNGILLISAVHPAAFVQPVNMEFVKNVWPSAEPSIFEQAATAFFQKSVPDRFIREAEIAGLIPGSMKSLPPEQIDLMSSLQGRQKTRAWRIYFAMVNSCSGENWREMEGGQAFYNQKVADAVLNDKRYAEVSATFWPALKAYKGPVRVIMGTCDYVDFGPMVWPRIIEHIPNGKLNIVPSSGHSIWMDQPSLFQEGVLNALDDITASGS